MALQDLIDAANRICDKLKKRTPQACADDVAEVKCECGKVFRRCDNHGGHPGALRSRTAHRGLYCAAWEAARGPQP